MRVLVCDDHPVYRAGLRMLLTEMGYEVVGEADSGESAVELATQLRPDVVVMDVSMPGIGGVEATRRIVATCPESDVLALTMHDDPRVVGTMLRAGAGGYLLKGAGHAEIAAALVSVAAGSLVVAGGATPDLRRELADTYPFPLLTPRERDVLEQLGRGGDNHRIAQVLGVSDKTVRNVVSAVLLKLGASSRAEAVAFARDAGVGHGRTAPGSTRA